MLNLLKKKKLYFLPKQLIFFFFLKKSMFYFKFNYFSEIFNVDYLLYKKFTNFLYFQLKMFNYLLFSSLKRFTFFLIEYRFGFYAILNMLGIGLFIEKCSASLFKFSLVSSHFIYMFLPKDIILKSSSTSFMVFGLTKSKVNNLVSNLLLLRAVGVYRLKGITKNLSIIFLKEGKKR